MHYLKKVILAADRIDYWIRRHVIQFCCETHPAQHKLASRLAPPMSAGRASAGASCLGAEARLGTAGLVAFPCSDCGSTGRALVLLAIGDLRYARFNTNGQDLAARAGE